MVTQIPDEMLRQGRPVEPDFETDEDLYIRFLSVVGKKVDISNIRCPNQSVNRSNYSEPEWVLLPNYRHFGHGVFKVADIPTPIDRPDADPYEFIVDHDPQDNNYSHCEIRAHVNGVRRNRITNRSVKLKFRMHLSQKIRILSFPNEGG